MSSCPYGFRILGATAEERRLVNATAALSAYAACDAKAEVGREAYLSAFTFGEDFKQLMKETGSCKGFNGPCWSPFVWWDIDREGDLESALRDTRRLAEVLQDRFALEEGELLIFYSGSKGFHLGLPTALWKPQPSTDFNRVTRRFAKEIALAAGVEVDVSVYDKVRAFRAPNSRHPKTGRHKRHLTVQELFGLRIEEILTLADHTAPFTLPSPTRRSDKAAADWQQATTAVQYQARELAEKHTQKVKGASLNRRTLEFIRNGALEGDRHRLLFSAAANLAEFNCPEELAYALLTEAGLDSGLCPSDVYRQIECGLDYQQAGGANE